ncbi:mannose-1-phosphate guanylyltransferase / mannose-6-phosphate isomerase [Cohaesibacter sp. ES.047]|uniref:mannose-1-phosphate guanylyltransferase/mannose-6-phosphate isomerase n=1 Tax=Cohaesibacter sp. ES.047 TaxID=1798205 RepID=UPI000BB6F4D3|nr:mannose-1-phosphate guanylyltransferase/mannose-6-phosphate isomerase [Cohaesibacter sp. ES.047]SNY90740.1 mannose-1-phosphate guanylyltransferase / mannose-6-phosphate isomerase [Cohaesibacter sp. ES.047]
MTDKQITPVLLCGGSGTRLWPLSRKSYPKQFAPLIGDQTLFQASALRLSGSSFGKPLILTNSDFRFIVTEQLSEIGVDPSAILIEPEGRNTAPAILAAAFWLHQSDPDALMLVAPSDHVIPDAPAFREAVCAGVEAALSGNLVTFGIKPTYPETGYGYLEVEGTSACQGQSATPLSRFVEKPDLANAEAMLASGNYLWNAGIFLFSVRHLIEAFKRSANHLLEPVQQSVTNGKHDLGFLRLDPFAWSQADDISIDYAVMEKAENLSVVPFLAGWSDLGGWDAVWRESEQTENKVALSGDATAIDCNNTLLRSEDSGLALVGVGLENIMAIAMPDAVLVADMSRAQDVRKAVDALKIKNVRQAETFPVDHRPWGWFETLILADRFQVKRIVVNPGAALSLQSHFHRSEHWIVVQGTAKVTVGDEVKLMTENQSIYIPLGSVHRMENPGKLPMVIIEIQTGAYLGEDDIVRYEDVYARG